MNRTELKTTPSAQDEYNIMFYSRVRKAYGLDTIWSISEVLDFEEVPFKGPVTLAYSGGWLDVSHRGEAGELNLGDSPNWLALWLAADVLIMSSGDRHHVFIEAIDYNKATGRYEITTGS